MEVELVRLSESGRSPEELKAALGAVLEPGSGVSLRTEGIERTRSFDGPVLVAVVSAAGTAIHALVVGLLRLKPQRVIVRDADGTSIEFEGKLSASELASTVALLERMRRPSILLKHD